MIRTRRLTAVQLNDVKANIKNPLTIWNFSKVRDLLQLWVKELDNEQTDLAIDTESLNYKIEKLKKHYNL